MAFPSIDQAQILFETIIQTRNSSMFPFKGDMESTFRQHCTCVASISSKIAAAVQNLDSKKLMS